MGATKQIAKPAPKRNDPPPEYDGMGPFDEYELVNKDPEKHYHWALEGERGFGTVEYFESRGYEMQVYGDETQVRLAHIGKRRLSDLLGKPIKRDGHVLVAIDRALKEQRDAARMKRYDAQERAVVDTVKGNVRDGFRGMAGNRYGNYVRLDRANISHQTPIDEVVDV